MDMEFEPFWPWDRNLDKTKVNFVHVSLSELESVPLSMQKWFLTFSKLLATVVKMKQATIEYQST